MADANLIFSFSYKLPQMHHQFFFESCQPERMEKKIIFKKNFPFKILYNIELFLGKFLKFTSYGYNQIYVFKKNQTK